MKLIKNVVLFCVGFFHLICIHGETPEEWIKIAQQELENALTTTPNTNKAKNVILFLGDGMGIATSTAARIYHGQLNGKSGEEGSLVFERLPWLGLSKTYNDDFQTPDSAGAATAFLCGQKAAFGVLGVNSRVKRGDCGSAENNSISSIVEWAQSAGKAAGIVTTTRITHATPAAAFAHTPDRDWEADKDVPTNDRKKCKDIALQLVEDIPGREIQVLFGGGRGNFIPNNTKDLLSGKYGLRTDGRDLLTEWVQRRNTSFLVSNKTELDALDISTGGQVLGLFAFNHLEFDLHRNTKAPNQPTLSEMTEAAIKLLRKNQNGFFLMVEGGKIDHAHHDGIAKLALHDVIAFDKAIEQALKMVSLKDTLFIGNSILGLVGELAEDGLPYTTLQHANGKGNSTGPRRNLTGINTQSDGFTQDFLVPLGSESHSGEDVAIYAAGPFAHLFHGLHEQHYIAHVMEYAACYNNKSHKHCINSAKRSSIFFIESLLGTLVLNMMIGIHL